MTTSRLFKNVFLIIILLKGHAFQKQTIPGHLQECYDDGILLLPMTMGIFIEIIRKIEMSPYFLTDIRMFSSSLFHRFCRDGIEKDRDFAVLDSTVIPFTTTGFQSYKYQLLVHYLLPKYTTSFSTDTLTFEERCTLHFMLSSSVDIWERGDEHRACPENFRSQNASLLLNNRRKSSCPIEKGVVETKGFGTVSLNHVIAGIVTALQPLQIHPSQILGEISNYNLTDVNNLIDNRWVSTFAGDLAEILIIQKPIIKNNYFFGPGGMWDDARLPTNYYSKDRVEVVEKELWQFTNAEIMGAIDGMKLGDEAVKWSQSRRILRLSQLLELYYTDKYTNYLNKLHACKRNLFYKEIFLQPNIVVQQVQSFSGVMAYDMPNYLKTKSIIDSESEKLVNQFNTYASMILINQEKCPQEIHTKMKIKLNVIYDNTWSHQETLAFLMNMAEKIDVSYHGSAITVIAGDMCNIIVKDCNSMADLFINWKYYVHDRGTMILPKSLVKLNKILNKPLSLDNKDVWYSHITLILAISTSLMDRDISDTMAMVKSIKQQNPDMIFVYVTSTPLAPMFVKLTSVPDAQNDRIITIHDHTHGYHQILEELDGLHFNPIAITPPPCINNTIDKRVIEMEEYVKPGSVNFYRIHPQYLCQVSGTVTIKLQNGNHGNLMACMSRSSSGNDEKECRETSLNENMILNIQHPCRSKTIYAEQQTWNEYCKPVYLRILAKQSLSLCTDNECRSPDDVRFKITIEGLKCNSGNNICNSAENILFSLLNMLLIFSLVLHILIL